MFWAYCVFSSRVMVTVQVNGGVYICQLNYTTFFTLLIFVRWLSLIPNPRRQATTAKNFRVHWSLYNIQMNKLTFFNVLVLYINFSLSKSFLLRLIWSLLACWWWSWGCYISASDQKSFSISHILTAISLFTLIWCTLHIRLNYY